MNKEIEVKISAVEDKVDSTVILKLAKAIKDLMAHRVMTLGIGYGCDNQKNPGFRVTNWYGSDSIVFVDFNTTKKEPLDDEDEEASEHKAWRESGEKFVLSKVKLAINYINSTSSGDNFVIIKDDEDDEEEYKIVNKKFVI